MKEFIGWVPMMDINIALSVMTGCLMAMSVAICFMYLLDKVLTKKG